MKYDKLASKPDLQQIQKDILDFWADEKIFEKSLQNKRSVSVFVDGPPFPTGMPHHGTILVSFIKDMIARYQTMRGFSVPRVWGWDCHGLPIETQVEKILGITEKKQIEGEIGVAKFNEACFNLVSANNDTWKKYVREMSRWVDYENSYKTMDIGFMESVLWTFKQCFEKGLIYKDYRVTPYCSRCETSLSISDTKESDSTRPRQDPWVMVKFKTEQILGGKPVSMLAWTTTPWTLPSNMALAVAEDIDYVFVAFETEVLVLGRVALQRYEKLFGKQPQIIKTCKGRDLVGSKYTPIFPYFSEKAKDGAFKIVAGSFISEDEGVGIVHIAPAFGEDDYWTCKANNIPLVNPVDVKGRFISDVADFTGRNVIEANQDIIRFLKAGNLAVDFGTVEHNYPHCWRCRGPLIYKAMDAWYFSVDKIKDKLIKANELINWVPDSVKTSRFGAWLENARDWNISRNRYWSTPIPVWECKSCGDRTVLGSIEEIYKASGVRLGNLHKQYMDKVTLKCKCGSVKERVPEVLDCWFEAGSAPHAQKHYPFENKKYFESNSPCDFVAEGAGQIRCWFYYLHVLSVALFGKPAFRNAIAHGTVLAKDGKKISKSLKNYTDPMELMQKFGTDAFRLYLFKSNATVGDMLFDDSGLPDALQQIILPFWSACNFFTSYAIIDGFVYEKSVAPDSKNQLDQWMLAQIYKVQRSLTEEMDKYRIDNYVDKIVPLIDGLTNWYIRRSRRRFWGNELTDDKKSAYETLSYVLVNICKLLAPAAPIVAEKLYKHLTGGESVHLEDWPDIPEKYENDKLIEKLGLVQNVINLARSIRAKNGIKNRQPLSKVKVALSNPRLGAIIEDSKQIICEELNVKELEIIKDVNLIAEVQYLPNFAVLGKKYPKLIADITKAIRSGDFRVSNDVLTVTTSGGGKKTLDKEDVLVKHSAKSGLYVAGGDGVVVALDLTVTKELVREGIAREIVRNIQDARKQLSCDISDTILIKFSGQQVPQEWLGYILGETLGKTGNFKSADTKCEIEIDAGVIIAEVKRLKS